MSEIVLSRDKVLALLKTFMEHQKSTYSLTSLGVFGSFARDEAQRESDVDIVFDTDAPNLFMTAMLKQDLEELLERPVDVLQLHGLVNLRLKARIEKEAVYV
ncbi:MAG: nucleotidyltransferase domain-containing protein [Chloroflexota bacterium]|nr:nucleotidyltransferase domain-containing protein [Chloroflexota bacterium]MEA3398068.1 nucleotidyltransferase domain-containing protein [Chloroflexota bacterium]